MSKNKLLKMAIVGHGFVGKATDWGFNRNVEKFIVDPLKNTKISDLEKFNPDIVFICVPTPMGEDGSQDSSIIENVMNELNVHCKESIKVVKSTVIPSILEKLHKLDVNLIYNPEFLREKHANLDFENSEMIIFGGKEKISKFVSDAYLNNSRCKTKKHIFLDLKSASLIKYAINSFLASKVIFFNELHSIYEGLNVKDDWESIISAISIDTRVGGSHMNVPGHDGRKGFGGACFPKDSLALIKYAENQNLDLSLLKNVVKKNNQIRSQYKELDARELEQNVSFDDKI